MLQQLTHIIIVSAICIIWGFPGYFFLKGKRAENYWIGKETGILIFLFFSGLLSIGFLTSWFVLLIPLKFKFLLIATGVLLLFILFFFRQAALQLISHIRCKISITVIQHIFIASCVLLFIVLGSLKSVNIDTQLYHLQIIRWTNEYGTVPGLANLYPRLGLGSNWFNLISVFHIPIFSNQNFTFLNTTVTIWFLLWLINKWRFHYSAGNDNTQSRAFSLFYFLLIMYFLFDWQLFRDTANSASYDFIVTALTIMVISFLAEELFLNKNTHISYTTVILSFLIIPFKLSGLFILIPVFFYLLNFRKTDAWIKSFAVGCLVLFPLLAKNYITTGYPLYPSLLSVDSPEWQLPGGMALRFQEYVFYLNKFYNHQASFIFEYDKTAFNWIPFWLAGILLKHKILLLLSSLSFFPFFKTSTFTAKPIGVRIFIASLWLMMAGWFFTAPDPRFALGFLLFLAFFPLSLFICRYVSINKIFTPAFALATLIVVIYTAKKSVTLIKEPRYLYQVTNTDIPPFQKIAINKITYNAPDKINNNWDSRCFFIPLPCLCEANPYLQSRTDNIKKGFMMKKPDSIFIKNYNY